MRVTADTKQEAEQAIREDLEREEVEPNGSVLSDFQLEPATTTDDKGEGEGWD